MPNNAQFYFQVSTSSGVPIYRQIIDQIKTHIASDKLKVGDYIPSVRQVAVELEINPMTVSKAYSLLVKDGILEFVRGQGMKVKGLKASQDSHDQREEEIIPLLREVITKTKQLSLEPKRVNKMIESLWKELRNE